MPATVCFFFMWNGMRATYWAVGVVVLADDGHRACSLTRMVPYGIHEPAMTFEQSQDLSQNRWSCGCGFL